MAVCNLFKKLTKETGNFLMFSQYADDLTKFLVRHNDAKAIPSHYILLNVDYSKLLSVPEVQSQGWDSGTPDLSTILPNYLQNYYENTCAFFRDYETQEENVSNFAYTPVVSRNVFWNAFSQLLTFEPWNSEATEISGPMSVINTTDNLKYIPEFAYRGDINLQSYTEEDNIGYNEIYCYVPNDAQKHKYCVKQQDLSNYVAYDRSFIEGYNRDDEGFTGLLDINIPDNTQYSYDESVSFLDEHNEYLEDIALDDSNFNFNTVLVLYDIYYKVDNDDEVRYRDIPLGLYVTGTINSDGTVNNSVTKYVSNSDIYGAGTSYGLRIATRFSVTPNATYIKEIAVDGGSDYTEFAKVMSSFSDTQAKMNEVLSSVDQNESIIKDQLSSFKNYRTNIPYIVDVNGTKYWFVNGKNTNATVMGEVGPQGATGPMGPAGQSIPGVQGVTGEKGQRGATGPRGESGSVGVTGPRGEQGVTGPRGEQGVTGASVSVKYQQGYTGAGVEIGSITINNETTTIYGPSGGETVPKKVNELIYSDNGEKLDTHELMFTGGLVVDTPEDLALCESSAGMNMGNVLSTWRAYGSGSDNDYNDTNWNGTSDVSAGTTYDKDRWGYCDSTSTDSLQVVTLVGLAQKRVPVFKYNGKNQDFIFNTKNTARNTGYYSPYLVSDFDETITCGVIPSVQSGGLQDYMAFVPALTLSSEKGQTSNAFNYGISIHVENESDSGVIKGRPYESERANQTTIQITAWKQANLNDGVSGSTNNIAILTAGEGESVIQYVSELNNAKQGTVVGKFYKYIKTSCMQIRVIRQGNKITIFASDPYPVYKSHYDDSQEIDHKWVMEGHYSNNTEFGGSEFIPDVPGKVYNDDYDFRGTIHYDRPIVIDLDACTLTYTTNLNDEIEKQFYEGGRHENSTVCAIFKMLKGSAHKGFECESNPGTFFRNSSAYERIIDVTPGEYKIYDYVNDRWNLVYDTSDASNLPKITVNGTQYTLNLNKTEFGTAEYKWSNGNTSYYTTHPTPIAGTDYAYTSVEASETGKQSISSVTGTILLPQVVFENGSRTAWNRITDKLFYNNGASIYRIAATGDEEQTKYHPADPNATTIQVGGFAEGILASTLDGMSFSALFDTLLFPTYAPKWTGPTASLELTVNNPLKIFSTLTDPILKTPYTKASAATPMYTAYGGDCTVVNVPGRSLTPTDADTIGEKEWTRDIVFAAGTDIVKDSKGSPTNKTANNSTTLIDNASVNPDIDSSAHTIKGKTFSNVSIKTTVVYPFYVPEKSGNTVIDHECVVAPKDLSNKNLGIYQIVGITDPKTRVGITFTYNAKNTENLPNGGEIYVVVPEGSENVDIIPKNEYGGEHPYDYSNKRIVTKDPTIIQKTVNSVNLRYEKWIASYDSPPGNGEYYVIFTQPTGNPPVQNS